ncbi:hypothetical protein IGI04_020919 [Brassica rapa subsp. trilocularis]|uniref:RING-CH-type domain-containing protein n=1 Tax=Brassica rapa subsp. trilocularis TaxID=1813537 RepID=A0ABQ7MK36_BRACM|nr:hypothetical protein IGI04_020919 [Brassica rapa subsp. trilocularis]
MDVSPEAGSYDEVFSAEDEDQCRICRSPEEPGNPLRCPCLCRGSIKFVHQDCLRTWLIRRGNNKCEVCGRSYSFVPVYSENAPERLSCDEFLLGVLSRAGRYLKMIVPWIVLILLNCYFVSLHPWGQVAAAEFQNDFGMSRKFACFSTGLLYIVFSVCLMTVIALVKLEVGDVNVRRFIGNGGGLQFLLKYMKILFDWYCHKLIHFLGEPPRLIFLPPEAPLHEFGVIRGVLFFLDDDSFAILAISVYVAILVVLLPVWIGRIGGSYLSVNSTVVLGYMIMLSVWFAYVGFLFALHQNLFPVIVRWLSLGVHFVAVKLPCLLWVFSVKSCKRLQSLVSFGIRQASLPAIFHWFSLGFHFITVRLPSFLWVSSEMVCKSFQSLVRLRIISIHREATTPPAIFQWFSIGFHFITVTLPRFLWVSSAVACVILSVLKEAFVLCFKIGVLPWIIGCWLGICTSPLFGTIFSQSFETVSHFPCMMFLRWSSGIVCLLVAQSCMYRIQEIVHKRAIWYLLDVTDPDYKITKMNFGHTFFALASHGVLLVILFHLPIRAITLISPSFFPLELWVSDEEVSAAAHSIYFHLLSSSPKWLIGLVKPAMELMVQNWIITVSSWLDLSDYLLVADQNVRPRMQPRRRWLLFCSVAEGSLVSLHGSKNSEDDTKDQRDNRFLLRIALMLMLAALSTFVVSTAFMALPILLGRGLLESLSFIMLRIGLKRDDLLAFWIGYSIIGQTYTITCFVYDEIQKGRFDLLLKDVFMWIRNGLLFSIWISVIPGLLGLLIELMIIIPLRVPLDESPVHFLIQDWLIGVFVLHTWVFLTMLTPINWFATEAWLRKLERIRNVGLTRVPSTWLLQDVIGSIINTLLTTLTIPYLLVKFLFPLLGVSESVTSATERLIWPALLALLAGWIIARITHDFIIYVHQLVFNERYLVGEILNNVTEEERT